MAILVEPLIGPALAAALPALARLRIEVFRAFPYLYDGTTEYEAWYLGRFARIEGAVVVAAFDAEELVGAATAAPLAGELDAFRRPLAERGFDVDRIFYFAESVLRPRYRGRGIGHQFFDRREAHARQLAGFTHATFCAVVRPEDHPARRGDYRALDAFWRGRGYAPVEGLTTTFEWKEIGEERATAKTMQFWIKAL